MTSDDDQADGRPHEPLEVAVDRTPDRPQAPEWVAYERSTRRAWAGLLNSDPEEAELHDFLETHPSMIPGGSGDVGPGGHHGSDLGAVFTKPRLQGVGPVREPDFMWVTRSTALITPILVEIEKPSKRWFTKHGRPTADLTQARNQLNEWRTWFRRGGNHDAFRKTYVLQEDLGYQSMEPHFVLVYGRRAEFEAGGPHLDYRRLREQRDLMRNIDEVFMTFDALRPRFDCHDAVVVRRRAWGTEAVLFSPVYRAGITSGELASVVEGLDDALDATQGMSAARRTYLKERFRTRAEAHRAAETSSTFTVYEGGYE